MAQFQGDQQRFDYYFSIGCVSTMWSASDECSIHQGRTKATDNPLQRTVIKPARPKTSADGFSTGSTRKYLLLSEKECKQGWWKKKRRDPASTARFLAVRVIRRCGFDVVGPRRQRPAVVAQGALGEGRMEPFPRVVVKQGDGQVVRLAPEVLLAAQGVEAPRDVAIPLLGEAEFRRQAAYPTHCKGAEEILFHPTSQKLNNNDVHRVLVILKSHLAQLPHPSPQQRYRKTNLFFKDSGNRNPQTGPKRARQWKEPEKSKSSQCETYDSVKALDNWTIPVTTLPSHGLSTFAKKRKMKNTLVILWLCTKIKTDKEHLPPPKSAPPVTPWPLWRRLILSPGSMCLWRTLCVIDTELRRESGS